MYISFTRSKSEQFSKVQCLKYKIYDILLVKGQVHFMFECSIANTNIKVYADSSVHENEHFKLFCMLLYTLVIYAS